MPITGQGWELHIERLGLHKSGSKTRTYGRYSVHIDGQRSGIEGFIAETIGPGDNKKENNGRRIEAGRYPVWTQFGSYRSIGYSTNMEVAGAPPMPGILLLGTNKRTGILIHPAHPPRTYLSSVGCLNPTRSVRPDEDIDFWESRRRVIELLESLRAHDGQAFANETTTRVRTAYVVIDGEPMNLLQLAPVATLAAFTAEPKSLSISATAAATCAKWLVGHFGPALTAAVAGKPYGVAHLCGIVCQETAYKWLNWIDTMSPQEIVERCVFDASGDYPGTSRSAFPVNTAAFRAKYGDDLTDMLIEEANKTRRLQEYGDKPWVYKGYGIFQYDLQHIGADPAFFRDKQWYVFDECLTRVVAELDDKLVAAGGDLWDAIRRYNGSGTKANQYAQNVRAFTAYCAAALGLPAP